MFVIYDLNGYISYCAGISFYILEKQISSAIRNKHVTDASKQFLDFLVQRQKEARWCGFQTMLVFLNVISIYFAWDYADYIHPDFKFWHVTGVLIVQLASQVGKLLCF